MERTFIHPKTGAPSRMNTANIGGRVPERTFPRDLTEVYREPTPAEALLQSPAYQEDQSNTFIWSSIRAIDEEMARLNISPEEAARRFPVTLKHVYSREKAERIADWFQRFADAWRF